MHLLVAVTLVLLAPYAYGGSSLVVTVRVLVIQSFCLFFVVSVGNVSAMRAPFDASFTVLADTIW